MKINSLLVLASFALLATGAGAAPSPLDPDTIVLPTYVVEAPRYQPLEQRINARLKEFREEVGTPVAVTPAWPALNAEMKRSTGLARVARDTKIIQVAKS